MENPLDFKKKLFTHCLQIHSKKIEDLKHLIDETQQLANEYGPPKDRYDSFRTQLLRKKDMYSQQLAILLNEQIILNNINLNNIYSNVSLGAFVETDVQKLFISVSLGKITFENDTIYAISTSVPFYSSIKDKKVGDNFVFNGKSFKILQIF